MTDDHLQARVQRIEADVHALYRMRSITDGDQIRSLIKRTFGEEPRVCIVFRGVQRDLNGTQIAELLAERNLSQAQQQRVSDSLRELDNLGFVTRTEKGRYAAARGLEDFGLDRTIKATLKKNNVPDVT